MTTPIRIGSRGSQLALWQANHIAAQLRERGHAVEIEVIRTSGDSLEEPAAAATANASSDARATADATAADGIFIKEIEDALAANRIDLAVHSLKDLPTTLDSRFIMAAVPPRADARDAFVCENFWGLHMLPSGATIATTSPRRRAMLLALRPDLRFIAMRGNIDTRLRKWTDGAADALVLACAGLDRLGRTESVHQRFSVDELCPPPGQGALALETRSPHFTPTPNAVILSGDGSRSESSQSKDPENLNISKTAGPFSTATALVGPERDATIHAAVRALNDAAAEYATQAERHVLAALGGGCLLPLGAFCHQVDGHWHLHAMVAALDGEQVAHVLHRAPLGASAEELGQAAAADLKARGALELLAVP